MKKSSVVRYQFPVIRKNIQFVFFLLLVTFCFSFTAYAQPDEPPKDVVPPPLKILSDEEKKQLEAETNSKKRIQLSLDLMEIRLQKSATAAAQNNFSSSLSELAALQAILENALNYLTRNNTESKKTQNNLKRLEIGLRKINPRLELIKREMPYKYGYYVQQLQKFVREARTKALDPLFDDSVVPKTNLKTQS